MILNFRFHRNVLADRVGDRPRVRRQLVVAPVGELDLVTSPKLGRALRFAILRGHRHVILDAQDVTFADSSFVHVTVAAYERLYRRGGSLRIVNAHGAVAAVLRYSGLPFAASGTAKMRTLTGLKGASPASR